MLKKFFHDYYAFVCHRSPDKPLALAIQRKLERYVIPKKMIEENGYPTKHIRHVCVDVTEFEDNNLHTEILNCLKKSDKLIVICSELSASPVSEESSWKEVGSLDWRVDPVATGWIGFEILNFINMDRADNGEVPFRSINDIREYLDQSVELLNDHEYIKEHPEINPFRNIIPIVAGGDPISRSCFHPIIKLAIDRGLLKWYEAKDWNLKTEVKARQRGERGKFIDLILAVLSPRNADEFRRRDKIRRRIQITLASVSIAFIAAFTTFAIDYRMPHVSNYSDYTLVNELPHGLNKLSGSEAKKQTDYYRITTTKYNKAIKLEHVNSLGTPVEDESPNHIDAPMIAVYKCRENWYPDVCEYLDRNEIVQMTYAYATDLKYVTFQENEFISNQVYPVSDLNEFGIPNRMKIDRYELIHDQDGMLIRKMYMSGVNYAYDDKGVAGEKYEYDTEGHLTYIHFVNRDGVNINNQDGIHGARLTYDDSGELSGYEYVNKESESIYCKEGYSKIKIEQADGQVTVTYLDPENSPIVNDKSYAIEVDKLGDNMLPKEVSYYGKDNNPAYSASGYHKAEYAYNENGDIIDVSLFNENGKLIIGNVGYARVKIKRDDNGNIIQEKYFGSDDGEILLENKASTIERVYSEDGYLLDESYYGIHDKPVYSSGGYHGFKNEYDDKNRLINTQYYGLDSKRAYTREGYHKIVFDYDDARGNLAEISLYNASDKLVPYSGRWARLLLSYNGGGQVTKLEYLDQFEKPVNVAGGYATIENEYDDSGRLIQTSYFDDKGSLCDDYYINNFGVLAGSRYFARVKLTYDDFGNAIRIDYFDTDDKLVSNYSFSSKESEYDETGHKISDHYLDTEGNPPKGYFSDIFYGYDDYGNLVKSEYYGENGTPMEARTTSGKNAHRIEVSRDKRGKILSRSIYDKNEQKIEKIEYSYDENGRELSEAYFDADNNRVDNEKGYSLRKYEYNSMGNQTREAYYGADDKLCKVSVGYAVCVQEYDENGMLTDRYYYDENEKPVNLLTGYSHMHEELNEYRNTVSCEFRDRNDHVILSYKVEYNDKAQMTKESLYGPDGKLYAQPDTGIAVRVRDYDDMGNQISEEYYSDEGTKILVFNECSGWSSEYDDKSLETKRTYYGADGIPKIISEGFASVSFTYDEYGREIKRKFFGEASNKINTKFGFASYEVQYDDDGEVQTYKYYDKDGKECSVSGKIRKVELNLHNGDVDINAARYNPESGEWENGAVANTIYNIYMIAYQNEDGEYDLLPQPNILLSPIYHFNDYFEDIKVKYKNVIDKNPSGDNDPKEADSGIQMLLSEYVNAVKGGNTDQLWELILTEETSSATVKLFESRLGIVKSEDEIRSFYYNFYNDELNLFKTRLTDEYGEYLVNYEIRDKIEYTKEMLTQFIEKNKKYGYDVNNIENVVTLNVAFTVSGNGKENVITESFFYPNMVMVKVSGAWKLLKPNGFPKPGTEELEEFLGIE